LLVRNKFNLKTAFIYKNSIIYLVCQIELNLKTSFVSWGRLFHGRLGGEFPHEGGENILSLRRHSRGVEISWDTGTILSHFLYTNDNYTVQ